jgi:hypothetical protein
VLDTEKGWRCQPRDPSRARNTNRPGANVSSLWTGVRVPSSVSLLGPPDVGHRVVVDRDHVASEQLPVHVRARSKRADGQEEHQEKHRVVQNRVDNRTVDDGEYDEQSGQSVSTQPPLVTSVRHPLNRSWPSGGPQSRRERPHREHEEADKRDASERVSERSRVAVRTGVDERDVRNQRRGAGDGRAAMPQRGPVQSAEGTLDRGQKRRQNERAGEQLHRVSAAQLSDEPAYRLAGRPCQSHSAGRRAQRLSAPARQSAPNPPRARWRSRRGRASARARQCCWFLAEIACGQTHLCGEGARLALGVTARRARRIDQRRYHFEQYR